MHTIIGTLSWGTILLKKAHIFFAIRIVLSAKAMPNAIIFGLSLVDKAKALIN